MTDVQHFRNTLRYIAMRQRAHAERDVPTPSEGEDKEEGGLPEWESVDVVGACLKMGISR